MSVLVTSGLLGPGPAQPCSASTIVNGVVTITAQQTPGGSVRSIELLYSAKVRV